MPEYNGAQMEKLVGEDLFLNRLYQQMLARGQSPEQALHVLFNSYVLDDSVMGAHYAQVGKVQHGAV